MSPYDLSRGRILYRLSSKKSRKNWNTIARLKTLNPNSFLNLAFTYFFPCSLKLPVGTWGAMSVNQKSWTLRSKRTVVRAPSRRVLKRVVTFSNGVNSQYHDASRKAGVGRFAARGHLWCKKWGVDARSIATGWCNDPSWTKICVNSNPRKSNFFNLIKHKVINQYESSFIHSKNLSKLPSNSKKRSNFHYLS